MNYNLIAYAADFVSFLLQSLGDKSDKVNQIVLFGSVARGEERKESDVDIFIDVIEESVEKDILRFRDEFYRSAKFKRYWALLGLKRTINCTIGNLKEWDELKRSLIANGLVLYGKYDVKGDKLKGHYLIKLESGSERKKNVLFWRRLYGYTQKVGKKTYEKKGLVEEYGGKKLAPGIFILPLNKAQLLLNFLKKNRLKHEITLIWKEE